MTTPIGVDRFSVGELGGNAMGDLVVDDDLLRQSASTLATIKREFDTIEDRRDGTADLWGHPEVKSAMHEFASNMDHHRRKLSEKIQTCGEKVEAVIEAFDQVDGELANSFEEPVRTGGPR
jgi:phage-related protein